jgi:minor extracellular serine protease Vpr
MRRFLAIFAATIFVATVTSPADAAPGTPTTPRATTTPVAGAPTFKPIDAAKIDPQLLPFLLDPTREATVILELTGAPVSVAEASSRARGSIVSDGEATTVRSALAAEQDALRPRLAALGADVLAQYQDAYDGIKVRVPLRDLARVAAWPGVERVLAVPQYAMANVTSSLFTGVPAAWSAGTGFTGKGVKVAVIDTGIDYTHADFGGSGNPADFTANDGVTLAGSGFPNAKVAGGFDFVGDAYDAGGSGDAVIPHPDANPLDCAGHGTHVAGTIGGYGVTAGGQTYRGPYDATTLSATPFSVGPGVAPEAQLYALKVFGCSGSTDAVIDAIDWAVKNHMNVINLSLGAPFGSLGSPFGGPDSPDAVAADNAAQAGIVVVAAGGNSGSAAYTESTPGVATRAIEVAAVDAVPSLPGAIIGVGSGIRAIDANGAADFPVSGNLDVLKDSTGGIGLGCAASDYASVRPGDVVVTLRGTCPRTDRATLGQAAGAAAVVMVNTTAGAFPPQEGTIHGVTIPFLGVPPSAGPALLGADGIAVTITGPITIPNPTYRATADFSAGGPRNGDSALKPDIAAPGVSVLSAAAGTGIGGERESGTSMAAPQVAGAAALILQAHPHWTPEQVKAALMNTASSAAISGYDPRTDGAGLVQPRKAIDTIVLATTGTGTASLSFGAPALTGPLAASQPIHFANLGPRPITYRLSTTFTGAALGVHVITLPALITVAPGRTASVSVVLSLTAPVVAGLPGVDLATGAAAPFTTVRGAVLATPTRSGAGIYPLRLPFLMAPRGLSNVVAPATVQLAPQTGATRDVATATLTNSGVHAGVADVFAWGLRSGPIGAGSVDIRAVGVQSLTTGPDGTPLPDSDRMLVFAINTWQPWSSAATGEFDILINKDTSGMNWYVLAALDHGLATAGQPDGRMGCFLFRGSDQQLVSAVFADAPANSSTLRCGVLASALGLSSGAQPITYTIQSVSQISATADAVAGIGYFDPFAPSISQGDQISLAPGARADLPLWVDPVALASQPSLGWMIVSPDDPSGPAQAETIPLVLPPASP